MKAGRKRRRKAMAQRLWFRTTLPFIWSPSSVVSWEKFLEKSRFLGGLARRRHFASSSAVFESNKSHRRKITDEGVIIYESDPSTNDNTLGLVWGSVMWPSGVSLAKYLVARKEASKDKRVLELGCGTAIVGFTISKLCGTKNVTLTDSESSLWPILRQSIKANDLSSPERIEIRLVDWRQPETFLNPNDYDLIVAADVLYSGMDKLFARVLASHLNSGVDALVACPYRKDSPLADFFDVCERLGLKLERLENQSGSAAGGTMGMNAHEIYRDCQFAPLDSVERRDKIADEPTFSASNTEEVQIFRIRRVSGTPEKASRIRRVGRM